jgi:hypothetical protein
VVENLLLDYVPCTRIPDVGVGVGQSWLDVGYGGRGIPVAWIIQGLFQDPARFMLVAKGKVDTPIGRAWM